jgi:acyl dehydratase
MAGAARIERITGGDNSMSISEYSMATLNDFVGRELGVSDWVVVDQARIDAFADCTGDKQWIHVDVERASRESPYGGTIAHGYLTLSLLAALAIEVGLIPADAAAGLNYGLDKVRFVAPVKAGARVRGRLVLLEVERKSGGRVILKIENELQIEGEDKPALIAETLVMLIARDVGTVEKTEAVV